MAHVAADRVKDTTTTTGTGSLTLAGAPPDGFRSFASVMASSDTTFYCIQHQAANEWEIGLGTFTASVTLARTTVIASSNAGAAVNLSAGTKDVFITSPAIIAGFGVVSPAQLTSNTNDWSVIADEYATVRFSTNAASRTITGLADGFDGRIVTLINVGTFDALIAIESSSSSAANRFADEVLIPPSNSARFEYDGTSQRWRLVGESANRLDRARRMPFFNFDFDNTLAISSVFPWQGSAISSGTAGSNTTNVDGNHPGIWRLTSSTTANGGYRFQTGGASQIIAGGEYFELIFRPLNLATTTLRIGFHDASTSADATDGVYVEVPTTGNAVLKTASNSTRTTSSTIAALSINTWYRVVIQVNRDATSATATIYAEDGTVLGTQTNTTNIPTAAGRNVASGIVATESTTTATAMVDLDYIAHGWTQRGLVR